MRGEPVSNGRTIGITEAWYVRERVGDPLEGPLSFVHADRKARKLSKDNASGLAEVVTYEGNRLFVVSTFLRGRLRFRGKRAQLASDKDLPPRT